MAFWSFKGKERTVQHDVEQTRKPSAPAVAEPIPPDSDGVGFSQHQPVHMAVSVTVPPDAGC